MAEQEQIFNLLQLPYLVLKQIIIYIPNRWNVSCTCKMLYEIVCSVEKFKYKIYIDSATQTDSSTSTLLTIDKDSIFNSILNSRRSFNEIVLHMDPIAFVLSNIGLSQQQLDRLSAIYQKFRVNITTTRWNYMHLTVDTAIYLLGMVPNLESLIFTMGKISGNASNMTIELPRLKKLHVAIVSGFFKVANLLPTGSIIDCSINTQDETPQVVYEFLARQRNVKSLLIWYPIESKFICHMQLECLVLNSFYFIDVKLIEMLKHQLNLRAISIEKHISGNSFKWICENLRQLENLDAHVKADDIFYLTNLVNLKALKCFTTQLYNISDLDEVKSNSLTELKIAEPIDADMVFNISSDILDTMTQNFPNLTDLQIPLDSIDQIYSLLLCFTNLTKLDSYIEYCTTNRFSLQTFPLMKHLTVKNDEESFGMSMIVDIARAMPNLEHLTVKISIKFEMNYMQEFIDGCKNLTHFEIATIVFEYDFLINSTFLELMRTLTDQLKFFIIVLRTTREGAYYENLKDILSMEINARIDDNFQSNSLTLSKGCTIKNKTINFK